jgi:hypothetical protein
MTTNPIKQATHELYVHLDCAAKPRGKAARLLERIDLAAEAMAARCQRWERCARAFADVEFFARHGEREQQWRSVAEHDAAIADLRAHGDIPGVTPDVLEEAE